MKQFTITNAASVLALVTCAPAFAQDEVQLLSGWNYQPLYADGWSVDNALGADVIGSTGEEIGDIENIIFSNEGEVLGIIAEVGGFWDIGDTHVHVPWEEITMSDSFDQVQVPVTEDSVDDYDVFGDYWDSEQVISEADTDATMPVNDDLAAGQGIFKATDLIGDYVYLSDGARYGYICDIIVQDNAISAIVADAGTYGRRGYYAYPYAYRGQSPMNGSRYDLPYGAEQIDTIENFNYEQLQSRAAR